MAQLDDLISEAINAAGGKLTPQAKEAYAKSLKNYVENGGSIADAFGLNEDNLEWIYAQAYSTYTAGKYNDAKILFKFLIKLDTSKSKYFIGLGACYFMLKDYESALYPYTAATLVDNGDPIPYYYMAECFLYLGHRQAALQTYDDMLQILKNTTVYPQLRERVKMMADQLRKELEPKTVKK